MPEATIEQPQSTTETFASFRGGRGASVDAVKEVERESEKIGSAATPLEVQPSSKESPAGEAPKADGESDTPIKQETKADQRKKQIQREIDDLVKQRETLKREVAPKLAVEPSKPQATDGSDPEDPEPTADKFDDWQKWQDARGRWLSRKEFRRLSAEQAEKTRIAGEKSAKEQADKQFSEDLSDFEARGEDFAKEHSDYKELYAELKKRPTLPAEIGYAALYSDAGPEVLYHLMTNPEIIEQIAEIKTVSGRYEAIFDLKHKLRLAQSAEPLAQPKRSNAPRPGTVLNGSGGGGGSKEPASFAQFRKTRFA